MSKLWSGVMPYEDKSQDFVPEIYEYPAGSKGAVIIFPGGGYGTRAQHEGPKYAEFLQSNGITAFVVDYRVAPYEHPSPISDAMRAIRYVRYNADKYGVDKNKIAVMGSSAGGHLAGSLSVHYDKAFYEQMDDIDKACARPDATILCYPVIDMGDYRHEGSRNNLLGGYPSEEMKELMSLHKQVTNDTPEAFIWHTAGDQAVSFMNSMLYAEALGKRKIPFELHVFPDGPHGLGLCDGNEYCAAHQHVASWKESLIKWLCYKEWK